MKKKKVHFEGFSHHRWVGFMTPIFHDTFQPYLKTVKSIIFSTKMMGSYCTLRMRNSDGKSHFLRRLLNGDKVAIGNFRKGRESTRDHTSQTKPYWYAVRLNDIKIKFCSD